MFQHRIVSQNKSHYYCRYFFASIPSKLFRLLTYASFFLTDNRKHDWSSFARTFRKQYSFFFLFYLTVFPLLWNIILIRAHSFEQTKAFPVKFLRFPIDDFTYSLSLHVMEKGESFLICIHLHIFWKTFTFSFYIYIYVYIRF